MTIDDDKNNTDGFKEVTFKYTGPKWDAHVHLFGLDETAEFINYAKEYNVEKLTAIIRDDWQPFEQKFPGKFVFAKFINSQNFFQENNKLVFDEIQNMADTGFSIVKFWYAPRWRQYIENQLNIKIEGFRIDDPKLDPIYSKIADLGLKLLIHVSDPDIFYNTKYQPESYFGTKSQHLQELEHIVKKHPNLKIIGAHMAGQPEHLDNLARWFDTYPNFFVDMSSAKWMAREFSYHPEQVADFFKQYEDKIMFATDIVTGRTDREPIPGYYYMRYLSLQALLETDVVNLPLPIADPENDNKTVINGLDLPMDVLRKIYWENAKKLFTK